MSNRRSTWIERRGQREANAAIDQIIERQPQTGEYIQQLADALIADSPYQARQAFSAESVEELAQGMREVGFQGILIVRPHSDPVKQRHGIVQLVFGHRRRMAWRQVCIERGVTCMLPVVVRAVDDAQLLTIGAQENLQRQDLDPIEEAQIVAWYEQIFFEKNQAEIGMMLGKSSDWVSTRSRIHKLPDALKDRLRQRPRAIKQLLELNSLYQHEPHLATDLADRVVREHLTFEALRAFIDHRPHSTQERSTREKQHNRRAGTTSVQDITSDDATQPITALHQTQSDQPTNMPDDTSRPLAPTTQSPLATSDRDTITVVDSESAVTPRDTLALLQEAVAALADIALHPHRLKVTRYTDQLVDGASNSVESLRADRLRRALRGYPHEHYRIYQIVRTEINEVLVRLFCHYPLVIKLRSAQTEGISLRLVLCMLLSDVATKRAAPPTHELFIAVVGGGNATIAANNEVSVEWARQQLKLQYRPAALVTALLNDLAKGIQHLQREQQV